MKQGAHVLILDPNGALIMQQRDPEPGVIGPGKISVWGGGIEQGEQPIDAAMRELHEELELSVKRDDLSFLGTYQRMKDISNGDVGVYLFIFNQRVDPESLTINEGTGYHLVMADDDLDSLNMTPLVKRFVNDFFARIDRHIASESSTLK